MTRSRYFGVTTSSRGIKLLMWICVFTLSIATSGFSAPRTELGVKAGLTNAGVYGNSRNDAMSNRSGICGGVYFALSVNRDVSIQTELLYVSRGMHRSYTIGYFAGEASFTETDKITCLELPVLLKFPFPRMGAFRPGMYFGGSAIFKLSARASGDIKVTGDPILQPGPFSDKIPNAKSFDFGPVVGVDASFGKESGPCVRADIRFSFGLRGQYRDDPSIASGTAHGSPVVDLSNGRALDLKYTGIGITLAFGWH